MIQLNSERVEKVRNYGLHVLSYDDRSAFLIALCEYYLSALRAPAFSLVRTSVGEYSVCTQPEPRGEPVAWMNDSTPMGVFARHKEGADNFGCNIPLYAAPQPSPAEALPPNTKTLDSYVAELEADPEKNAALVIARKASEVRNGLRLALQTCHRFEGGNGVIEEIEALLALPDAQLLERAGGV